MRLSTREPSAPVLYSRAPNPMTLLLLIRHASTDWVGRGLAGRMPGVGLSDQGQREARELAEQLRDLPLEALYASPLERTQLTAAALAQGRDLAVQALPGVIEVDFGDWTGQSLEALRSDPLWVRVQTAPSRMRFPGGESPAEVQARALQAVETLLERHPAGRVAVVSHADVIKLLLTAYAGAPLDAFQRFDVAPASVSAIAFSAAGPLLRLVNHQVGSLTALEPPAPPGAA